MERHSNVLLASALLIILASSSLPSAVAAPRGGFRDRKTRAMGILSAGNALVDSKRHRNMLATYVPASPHYFGGRYSPYSHGDDDEEYGDDDGGYGHDYSGSHYYPGSHGNDDDFYGNDDGYYGEDDDRYGDDGGIYGDDDGVYGDDDNNYNRYVPYVSTPPYHVQYVPQGGSTESDDQGED